MFLYQSPTLEKLKLFSSAWPYLTTSLSTPNHNVLLILLLIFSYMKSTLSISWWDYYRSLLVTTLTSDLSEVIFQVIPLTTNPQVSSLPLLQSLVRLQCLVPPIFQPPRTQDPEQSLCTPSPFFQDPMHLLLLLFPLTDWQNPTQDNFVE